MRRLILILTVITIFANACSRQEGSVKFRSDTDSVAYIIGMNIGANLIKMDSTINIDALCRGIRDIFESKTMLTSEEAKTYYLQYINYAIPEKTRAYEEQFLADFAKANRSYARTKSGITYTVSEIGDQDLIPSVDRDTLVMRYIIRDMEGKELYSSYERGDSLRTAVGALNKGLRESIKLVGQGGKISAWLPAATAYGTQGDAQLGIAPNATLFYEIELIEVDKYSRRRR